MKKITLAVFLLLLLITNPLLSLSQEKNEEKNTPSNLNEQVLKQLQQANRALQKRLDEQAREFKELKESQQAIIEELKKQLADLLTKADELKKEYDEKNNALEKTNRELDSQLKRAIDNNAKETQRLQKQLYDLQVKTMGDLQVIDLHGIEFVKIPAGAFTMGTPEEQVAQLKELGFWSKLYACETPSRMVTITRPFLVSTCEITQKQWRDVMGDHDSTFKADDRPVENINYYQASNFARNLSEQWGATYRLPTEAEWEYCARAGSGEVLGLDEEGKPVAWDRFGDYAWFSGNSEGKTRPVAKKKPNAWGLFDMHGNVWEWCLDRFACDAYASLPEKNPHFRGESTEAVFRGGCWDLDAQFSRPAFRGANLQNHRAAFIGMRLLRELDAS